MRPSSFFSPLCQITLHGLCIFTFVALSVPLAANERFAVDAHYHNDYAGSSVRL